MTVQMEWAEKYRPVSLDDVVGHKKVIGDLRKWGEQWELGIPDKRAAILHGQAGIGKTSSAHALARDMGWEVIELNASDQRTAGVIEKVAGSASTMQTLTGNSQKRLVILDEADNLHGNSDRGGARAIVNVIKKSSQPIVLIANDIYGLSSTLRSLCLELKFGSVQSRSMIPALKKIAAQEGVMCGAGVIEKIAGSADGDFRSAVNDLQAISMGRTEIFVEDISTSDRDNKESIFKVVGRIFKGKDVSSALEATYNLDETPEDLIHWVDENLPHQYTGKGEEPLTPDIVNTYSYLSRSDRFLGRVRRRQNYRMWRYAGMLMTGGTVVSKSRVRGGFVKYQPPSLWRKMGQMRSRRNMRNNIAVKIGSHCNESMRFSRLEVAGMYSRLIQQDEYAVDVVATLGLTLDELLYLKGSKKVTKKLQAVYDEAQEIRQTFVPSDEPAFFVEKAAPKKDPSQLSLDRLPRSNNGPSSQSGQKDADDKVGSSEDTKKEIPKKPQKTLFDF
ncbi:replication factor C large subunit [Methanolobus bombayensis]|uniref:replication factor C large subunit n=1 Tax=Methanolobus bombayensis TaxID=38023 RepID=UPI001AE47772|nr:replication factor C large subunit [Methanolobus bombayensis]MBP1908665.1 replication factor C large subunit [Methanolobus bombayensis]